MSDSCSVLLLFNFYEFFRQIPTKLSYQPWPLVLDVRVSSLSTIQFYYVFNLFIFLPFFLPSFIIYLFIYLIYLSCLLFLLKLSIYFCLEKEVYLLMKSYRQSLLTTLE